VGVRPNVEFLEGSGVDVDDGVIVDDHLRSSVDDVYAIGDVARFDDVVSARQRRIEHWSNADAQGRYLGQQLAGARQRFENVPAFFTKLFDVQLQLLGDTNAVDEIVVRGSIADHNLVCLYLQDDRLAAAALVGQTEDTARDLAELIHERSALTDRSGIGNPDVRPTALFAS
jgi:NADPH-dependent 2,4-dienoyl-CoA reductase/sulfur reductase-like enzyme